MIQPQNPSPKTKLAFATRMQLRSKQCALDVIRLFDRLPSSEEGRVFGRQRMGSGTYVASNYRAVCRAKSAAGFISKRRNVEEANECVFWLVILEDGGIHASREMAALKCEADELLRIFSASLATAKGKHSSNL